MENKFNHFDSKGNAIMVDVSEKNVTERTAIAKGKIYVNSEVMDAVLNQTVKKGDVLGVARIAGIMGVKRTSDLIPMCHPLMISKCSVDFDINKEKNYIEAICIVKVEGKTGVEMEALTGVNITLLTIYDMCKAIDKTMEISDIHLLKKTGGKSGDFLNEK
ncbi:cyclic pyranopterin phosphate synthase [Clostridium saccharoperbutylacetonicum]|jgi:cyclic pyranopterin phosphate synthase|uniref:Cyclic pyranopterin monophosphate synthase n=1 Tax=Clostridium saccharoperbutylacetonicum N1-4(HMT) TaxID=931276 RepID=M1LUN5_9CLOT|nr:MULTISPECIES: cyclic pyranopterin monophosphate synthase MoaC [Clostridium]AGF56780.1 molybdenum cofactor biosynthesis protein C [Clostridium saccharoperbutylacetonicum N1-4(HMT)]NRT62463.1 cyclic pyranopterin phosphate synthase [Clostridium saccharoperbutylacetonicum]NSB25805.1 cyclic pyranopterin phosphate synthase [Clostridium saccharoperbutylacetonicum]NSB45169.1 cyclic pyranopterin phosphate synthase [Clostridium saccharoperbutylacetonicum]